jgi:transketolase
VRIGTVERAGASRSTRGQELHVHATKFKEKYPRALRRVLHRRADMVGAALGFSGGGFVPCASTFGGFFSRAYDFIRMAAYSAPRTSSSRDARGRVDRRGRPVADGARGPGDECAPSWARRWLYPSDGTSAGRLVEEAIRVGGIVYLRLGRPKKQGALRPDEKFPVGGSKTLRSSAEGTRRTIVAAGVTLHEALMPAHDKATWPTASRRRVIDLYSVKPLDHGANAGPRPDRGDPATS